MNKPLSSLSLLILVIALPKAAFSGPHDQDETAIRNVETQQQEAWNRHDAKAYADLFTEDGDLVNVGRAQGGQSSLLTLDHWFW